MTHRNLRDAVKTVFKRYVYSDELQHNERRKSQTNFIPPGTRKTRTVEAQS